MIIRLIVREVYSTQVSHAEYEGGSRFVTFDLPCPDEMEKLVRNTDLPVVITGGEFLPEERKS